MSSSRFKNEQKSLFGRKGSEPRLAAHFNNPKVKSPASIQTSSTMVSKLKNARSVASIPTGVIPTAPVKALNQPTRNRLRPIGQSHDTMAAQKFKFKEKVAMKLGGQHGQYVNSSRNSGMPLHSKTYRQEAPTI